MATSCVVCCEMSELAFLNAFGVDVGKGEPFIRARRQAIEEALVKGPGKKDNLRRHAARLLYDLWSCGALQRGSKDQAARSIELIVKAVFQYSTIPMIDWKKVVQDATDWEEPSRALPDHRGPTRSRSPPPPGRSLQPLPRRRDQTPVPSMARSKSKSAPPQRVELMNSDQRKQSGAMLAMHETPQSQLGEPQQIASVAPRRLFAADDLRDDLSLVPVEPLLSPLVHGSMKPPSAVDKFQAQRAKWAPLHPRESAARSSQMASPEGTMDFVFHCREHDRLDRLFLFYRELAVAGVFVDVVYWGTEFHDLINAAGFRGSDAVPAVKTKLGPSINFHMSTTGRVRLDGRMEQKEILSRMLQRVFSPFDSLHTNLGRSTSHHGSTDADKLAAWIAARQDKVLLISHACMFDGFGVAGVWDKINQILGARGVTPNTSIPWLVLTRQKLGIAVWPSGKVQIQATKSSLVAVETLESLLVSEFSGKWLPKDRFEAQDTSSVKEVTYGVLGELAKRVQSQVFGYAGP